MDYLVNLSPEELAYMKEFVNRFYRAQFFPDEEKEGWGQEERRKSYARKNAANRDFYTRSVDFQPYDEGDNDKISDE